MIRYSRRYVEPDDVCLFERLPCFRTEVVVERLCWCARCGAAWWAEAGKVTAHRCPFTGVIESFAVPV